MDREKFSLSNCVFSFFQKSVLKFNITKCISMLEFDIDWMIYRDLSVHYVYDSPILWNQLLIFQYLENQFFRKSSWISVNWKIKHFRDIENSSNELWNLKNASAYLRSIFQKVEFKKDLQCGYICDIYIDICI